MQQAYLLLGGNTGNRKQFLQKALRHIEAHCGRRVKQSAIYETAAWGKTDQRAFLNQVVAIATPLPPEKLLSAILEIEKSMGRVRTEKYAPRTIDIDILFYGTEILNRPNLVIPHPEIPNRRFVLEPLAEIAPRKKHPALGFTITRLLRNCTDELPVKRL